MSFSNYGIKFIHVDHYNFHVLNCFCKKSATTMSIYINYFQKEKETFLLFFFLLFVVEINDLKSGITEQTPNVTPDEV